MTSGFTPHRRDPRTKMPEADFSLILTMALAASKRKDEAKNIMKGNADKRQYAKANSINIGDSLYVRQHKQNKLATPYYPTPLVIIERKGTVVTAERRDGSKVTINVSMFNSIPQYH